MIAGADKSRCDVEAAVEAYLLDHGGWVKAEDLAFRFGVRERQFRQLDGVPGLCSAFAISGDHGFKHIRHATTAEWLRFKHRLRRHGIGELIRVRDLDSKRRNVTRPFRAHTFERDSGQSVMLFPE